MSRFMPVASFTIEELASRRDRCVERMRAAGLDVLIVTSALNVHYLTGIELGGFVSPQALVITSGGRHVYVVRAMEMTWRDHWRSRSWCNDWASYRDDEDPFEVIGERARDIGGASRRVGLELDRPSCSYAAAGTIALQLGSPELVGGTEIVEGLRRVKSPSEIAVMRSAGEITVVGLGAQVAAIRGGSTDAEAVGAAYAAMLAAGSSLPADPPFLPMGTSSDRAHDRWSGVRPRPGDVVTPMLSASVGRYHCPLERSFVFGGRNDRVEEIIGRVIEVQERLLAALGPGLTSAEADAIARDRYRAVGLAEFFLNRLAYSIGIAYPPAWWENEVMQLRPGDDRVIEAGMTFHLVPCLTVPGVGFINRSLPIAITDTGCVPLVDLALGEDPR